jgi:hypothetical protein
MSRTRGQHSATHSDKASVPQAMSARTPQATQSAKPAPQSPTRAEAAESESSGLDQHLVQRQARAATAAEPAKRGDLESLSWEEIPPFPILVPFALDLCYTFRHTPRFHFILLSVDPFSYLFRFRTLFAFI